jgi:hypothetical protein
VVVSLDDHFVGRLRARQLFDGTSMTSFWLWRERRGEWATRRPTDRGLA